MSEPVDYPYWAGRLCAALEMALRDTTSPTLAVIDRQIAAEALDEYQHLMGRSDPKVSPAGDRRERAVPCSVCHDETWNIAGRCDRHLETVGA